MSNYGRLAHMTNYIKDETTQIYNEVANNLSKIKSLRNFQLEEPRRILVSQKFTFMGSISSSYTDERGVVRELVFNVSTKEGNGTFIAWYLVGNDDEILGSGGRTVYVYGSTDALLQMLVEIKTAVTVHYMVEGQKQG